VNRVRAGIVARHAWWFRPRAAPEGDPPDRTEAVRRRWRPHPAAVVAVAGLAGSIPFSNLAARARAGVDLRDVGTGTVSGTALFDVAGFGPLAVAGLCDVFKGSVGPVLAGRDRPALAAVATGAGVAGHNWSPWLRGAGGRGISPALGALVIRDWPGTVTLAIGLAAGRLAKATGLGSFLADVALVPVLHRTKGRAGAMIGVAVVGPLLAKRLMGNRRPDRPGAGVYLHRLVFDRDPAEPAG
jgi:acyl phosphate:glycerol-3-phosphate acyltransferase